MQVIDRYMELGALAVRGNHDDSALHRWHAWRQEPQVCHQGRHGTDLKHSPSNYHEDK
jgi:hypothetical protein